jgi:hypothetical protein
MSLQLAAWRLRRGSLAASLMVLVILHAVSGFARPCDEDGVDRNGIRLTRSAILTHCDCDGTHQAYEKCVVRRVDKAIKRGVVPYAVSGSGRSAGRSISSKSSRRERLSLRIERELIRSRSGSIASHSSPSEPKVRLRSAARIQRSASSTPCSTFALSRGWYGRAGITATA